MSAGGIAAHESQRGAEALLGVIDQPFADVEAVLIASWVRMLGGESVPDRDNGLDRLVGEVLEHRVLVGFGLQDPPSTVDMVEDGLGCCIRGLEHAARDLTARISRRDGDIDGAVKDDGLGCVSIARFASLLSVP
nr:hypothetical protein CFP56_60709 [Quercus suber]